MANNYEDNMYALDNLSELTSDTLDIRLIKGYDYNRYEVYIKEHGDGSKSVGTNMIRRLIENKYVCLIEVVDEGEGSGCEPIILKDAQTLGVGSGSIITFNKYFVSSTYVALGNKSQLENIPKYIELGHELIHALNG